MKINWDSKQIHLPGNARAIKSNCGRFMVRKSLDKKDKPYSALFSPGAVWINKGEFDTADEAKSKLVDL